MEQPSPDDSHSLRLSNGNHQQIPYEALDNPPMDFGGSMPTGFDRGGSTSIISGEETSEMEEAYDNHILQRRTVMGADQVAKSTIIHRVTCGHHRAEGEDHQAHPSQADYLDIPRLFAKDFRGTALRGQKPLLNPQEYWDDHPEICVAITREYNCSQYHRTVRTHFQAIANDIANDIDRHVFNQLKPWLFRLPDNGPPAVSVSESIMISPALTNSLITLAARNRLGEWNSEHNLKAPYDYFYHFRHDLRELSKNQLLTAEQQELDVLLDYIDQTQGGQFDDVDGMFEDGRVSRNTFSKLFRPNDVVVTLQEGQMRAYVAEKVSMGDGRSMDRQSINLDCWTWDFDGSFRKKQAQLTVTWPASISPRVPITQLAAWPLRLDKSDLRAKLQKRGEYVWKCRKRRMMSYTPPTPTIFELQVTNPKYMIDYSTYRQMHPTKFAPLATEIEMEDQGVYFESTEPPDVPNFCVLLPGAMLGYAFHDKKWRSLSMDHVEDVPWNKKAFDRLVLKGTKKDTIKALVSVHLTTVQNVDVVENKGNGLIILLHGSPGTGKTLTAESVAEIAEKPLYRVTCGDIGTDAESVEKYMESVLLIGTIWECVVLLDEADVFLEERQVTDLARNALVSVFLRVLEYYDGILILTTNRVGTFDEAFKSRIQLAIHYPALDRDGRYKIWLNFLRILQEKKVDMATDEMYTEARTQAEKPFNGRQIRNLLWTAAQVAKHRGERLEPSHLETVVEISEEFEDYLKKTYGGRTDEQKAVGTGVRAAEDTKDRKK